MDGRSLVHLIDLASFRYAMTEKIMINLKVQFPVD